jgi:hypothetical protein
MRGTAPATLPDTLAIDAVAPSAARHSGWRRWNSTCVTPSGSGMTARRPLVPPGGAC